jgi:hypothetical protein
MRNPEAPSGSNPAQIGDAHGQPQSHGSQCNREGKRSRIREHPVAEVIRLVWRLMGRSAVGFARGTVVCGICRGPSFWQSCMAARPELEHDVLFF